MHSSSQSLDINNIQIKNTTLDHKNYTLKYLYSCLYTFDFNIITNKNVRPFMDDLKHFFNIVKQNESKYRDDYQLLLQRYEYQMNYIRNKYIGKGRKLQYYAMLFSYYIHYPASCKNIIQTNWLQYRQFIKREGRGIDGGGGNGSGGNGGSGMLYNKMTKFQYLSKIAGSFCDFKYFCGFIVDILNYPRDHPLITICIQLYVDLLVSSRNYFMAKWTPREKSKYGWIFKKMARYYISNYIRVERGGGVSDCRRHGIKQFRLFVNGLCHDKTESLLASSDNHNNTDIKLYGGYSNLMKYKYSLTNKNIFSFSKIDNDIHLFNRAFEPGLLFKHMYDFIIKNRLNVHDIINGSYFNPNEDDSEDCINIKNKQYNFICLLNRKWSKMIYYYSSIFKKKDFILFLDLSYLNFNGNNDNFYHIIGNALFFMNFSTCYKRIMLASSKPYWLNFSQCPNLFQYVCEFIKIRDYCDLFTSCEMTVAISRIIESFQLTENENPITNYDVLFLQGSKNAQDTCCNDALLYYQAFFKRMIFWNFCDSEYINCNNNTFDDFDKKRLYISGSNINTMFEIWNESNLLERFLHKIKC